MATSQSLPPIFKLNTHCCDEIFDYLSIKDLHSLGQTCKAMQRVAGRYFKENHWAADTFVHNESIDTYYSDRNMRRTYDRTQTCGFNKYVTYIISNAYDVPSLEYIQNHEGEFDSIKHIRIHGGELRTIKKCLRKILPKIETMQIYGFWRQGDIYEDLLTNCTSLKRLFVEESQSIISQNKRCPWLLQRYPQLECLELIPLRDLEIPELNEFFAINTTVREFSTTLKCLLENYDELLESTVKLDILAVHCYESYSSLQEFKLSFELIGDLLNKLHEKEFYQRVHLYTYVTEETSLHLASIKGVEKLCIRGLSKSADIHYLSDLSGIKELAILSCANPMKMQTFADYFANIERLYLKFGTVDAILPFVQQSSKLSKIYFGGDEDEDKVVDVVKLSMLNRERAKLARARKVTIYVPDHMFSDTKWTMGNVSLDFVEIRWANSFAWDHQYTW